MVESKNYKKNNKWKVSGNDRVRLTQVIDDGRMCEVRIHQGAIGTYTVSYGDSNLEVTID